jgi:hypothetical protein
MKSCFSILAPLAIIALIFFMGLTKAFVIFIMIMIVGGFTLGLLGE